MTLNSDATKVPFEMRPMTRNSGPDRSGRGYGFILLVCFSFVTMTHVVPVGATTQWNGTGTGGYLQRSKETVVAGRRRL